MLENNQEEYKTLGWIINTSEDGLFLAVADETIQKEIVEVYQGGNIGIYDYRKYSDVYSFQNLKKWIDNMPEIQTFFIVNFQFAIQEEQDWNRLNFSRDMLVSLKKNLIFLLTPYADNQLAIHAYDFYSFIKIRMIFQNYNLKKEDCNFEVSLEQVDAFQEEWNEAEIKKKIAESYLFIQKAVEERHKANYQKSIKLLVEAKRIREKFLGEEHLETMDVYYNLAKVYGNLGEYEKAKELCQKTLKIYKEVLGENHPKTATSYNNLGTLYEKQGKYKEAEELYKKSLSIREKILGENHPDVATSYNNLGTLYEKQGKDKEAKELYKKSLSIYEKILGENHPDAAIGYNNLAILYEKQGIYEEAKELYKKSLSIYKKILGEKHPKTQTIYSHLTRLNVFFNKE